MITFQRGTLAQGGTTAQLSGVVTDPTDAAIVGATVSARNVETGLTRSTNSSGEGRYLLEGLPPGGYELTVEANNFGVLKQSGVQLTIGQNATLHFSLQIARVTEELTILGDTSLTEPARTEESQVIDLRRIDNLPINGRQFLDFALLAANVGRGRSNTGNSFRPGEPGQIDISFAGLDEIASLITVDGADNIGRTFGRSRSTPPQDAVREFRVVQYTYGADLGPAASAVVNIVTKSGTNAVHGSSYDYVRNDAFDARNLLAPPGFDKLRQNQFGATLGGAAIRDRFFLFGGYEGQRRSESPSYSSVLLSNLSAINAAKQSIGLPPEVLEGKLRQTNYDSMMARSDYQPAPGQLLTLTYRLRDERNTNIGASTGQTSAPSNFRNADIQDHAVVANWTSTSSSSLFSQGLFQFARRRFDFASTTFEPYLQVPNTVDMGRHVNAVDATGETRFEGSEMLGYKRGAHSIKVGGDLYHVRQNFVVDVADPGMVLFPNLDAFLGKPPFPPFPFAVLFQFAVGPDGSRPPAPQGFKTSANLPAFDALTRYRSGLTHFALFATDQWRAAPRLTLNYGLRWDTDNRPAEFYQKYYKAFQPRAGLAYSLLSDRLVWRMAGGVYQGVRDTDAFQFAKIMGQDPAFGAPKPEFSVAGGGLHLPTISDPSVAAPAFLQFVRSKIYPTPAPGQPPYPNFLFATHRTNARGLYTYQWSTQVDYRLSGDLGVSVGYVGVRGLHLSASNALNVAPATLKLPNGENDYGVAPGVPVARTFNPLVAPLSLFSDDVGQSSYHAGTVTLTKRFSRYYALGGHYTWSKTINDNGVAIPDLPEDVYRRDLERALSKQHVPHRFVGNMTVEGPERTWLKDFRFALISIVAAAPFYTVYAGVDANHDGNPLSDRVGRLGRSTFKGDNYVNVDVRLSRRVHLSERVQADIVAEAFNLFNTLNVMEVNSVYGAPELIGPEPKSFDQPVPAPLPSFNSIRAISPPRQIQFALRITY
jgi:hypothetical protein